MAGWQKVATRDALADLAGGGRLRSVVVGGQVLVLGCDAGRWFALDNRCPHMGFPLDQGTVQDGIVTCHWHHARFCSRSGGTFDPWADDGRAFPLQWRGDTLWVDLALSDDAKARLARRLQDGLERNISLVIAKAVIQMLDAGLPPTAPFRIGLEFGVRYHRGGWASGLTMLVAFMRLLPHLEPIDQTRALTHGLAAVAADCAGSPPRFLLDPLPTDGGAAPDPDTCRHWLRTFTDTRDSDAAERCVISAVHAGADPAALSTMLMDAATLHRYINTGHVLDFVNKAGEALDLIGWDCLQAPVLSSLCPGLADADRAEESRAWQSPVDLVGLLDRAFAALPAALATPRDPAWHGEAALSALALADDPAATVDALLAALRAGAPVPRVARAVVTAAATRIAQFHVSNEHGDWVRALHAFTFANAVHQGLRRAPDPALAKGIFDAAMTVYLNRFLNIPAARIPAPDPGAGSDARAILDALRDLYDRQQQVDRAGQLVADYFAATRDPRPLIALLGQVLVREDRDFHAIQMLEAAVTQYSQAEPHDLAAPILLIAAARYMAAHFPTRRAQNQRHRVAWRLHRGDALYQADPDTATTPEATP